VVESLGSALVLLLAWENFLLVGVGILVGVTFGAIPGLSGLMAVALLLPFTFFLSPLASMALLLGAYKGCLFGGSISAVTFGVPGDAPATATVLDGYPLTKKGMPHKALTTALYSSIAGNFIADFAVIFTFVPLGMVALKFGSRELFAVMLVALTVVIMFSTTNFLKGIISASIGFFVASIGLDPIMGIPRLTFGIIQLQGGIALAPFILGLFAFSEFFFQFSQVFSQRLEDEESAKSRKSMGELVKQALKHHSLEDRLPVKEWLTCCWREVLIGSGLGIALGALPGPGATMSAFTTHATASRLAKNRGRFGTGAPEGVAAAESGNSATCGPTLIPLFLFGIPGSATAGLFLGAFLLQGISPGPGLLRDHMPLMLAIFMVMLVGSGFNLVISKWLMLPIFARLGLVSSKVMIPVLIPLMIVGIYSLRLSEFDVLVMAGAGLLGVAMRRFQVPIVPCAIAYMIGALVEAHFRRGLIIADSPMYWFSSPIALGFYIAAIVVAWLVLRRNRAA